MDDTKLKTNIPIITHTALENLFNMQLYAYQCTAPPPPLATPLAFVCILKLNSVQ